MQVQGSPIQLSRAEFEDSLSVIGGQLSERKITVYGIFRNEMSFVQAFLQHYRSLGAEQFLILDDSSDDGTREHLLSQPDCVVLQSSLAFRQRVIVVDAGNTQERAGTLLKSAIPKRYLPGRWAVYADADEFLFLPPGVGTLQPLVSYLERRNARSVVASLVDFYPLDLSGYNLARPATSLAELLEDTPYFDATPLLIVPPGEQPKRIGIGASMRLFEKFGIREIERPRSPTGAPRPATPRAAWLKTPLLKWDDDVRLDGSHYANILPPADIVLTLAHFKFGPDIVRRTATAIELKSHSNNSRKYVHYDTLIRRMQETGQDFTGPASTRFRNSEDFIGAGLMVVPEALRVLASGA